MRKRTLLFSAGVVAFGAGFYVRAPAKEPEPESTAQTIDSQHHICEIQMLVYREVITPAGNAELEDVRLYIPIVTPCHLAEQAVQDVFQTIDLGGSD